VLIVNSPPPGGLFRIGRVGGPPRFFSRDFAGFCGVLLMVVAAKQPRSGRAFDRDNAGNGSRAGGRASRPEDRKKCG
jgi:hypothetical protein